MLGAFAVTIAILTFMLVMTISFQFNGGEGHEKNATLNNVSGGARSHCLAPRVPAHTV